MIKFFKRLFSKEKTNQVTLPLKETRSLSKVEIEYIINEFTDKQNKVVDDMRNNSIDHADIEFNELMTNRITNNLKYRIPFLAIELVYLNNTLRGKKVKYIKYKLFHQVKDIETTEITDMVINQGYSFVPSVGYLKIG
ncbi:MULTISPECIES: hypothetical protein [unclassified Bacillus (in: firmicutes)]|uniref:hypothetical protein n=1 Tax=unclassified Bacillus (in: firmicutes) TaxID=185979 RepID=UPI000BEFC73C|nr:MULTISPECIES: hypothetical protein [unclassified Bacillus (in: firmicutes)]PEJ60657.1 hypothetical protein CN692_00775 [Bacillus sp. AFS002410]PEL09836.1 hypothetical protein CN601_14945 [Bacillus sp. AFS017336]